MKKIFAILFLLASFPVFSQNGRSDIDRQIEEIMKAREEMIKSLLNDSGFQNFDDRFDDLVKKFQQDSFGGMPGMDMGAVVGEYDWRESDTHQILVLKVKQIKDRPLDIKIEKGQIKLKGDVESVSEGPGKKGKRISKVHFERSFSIPEGVDQSSPEFENKDGELLIKFKKL
ncbi:MAG: Hsp20/alpha crystallin family protein, partial [Bacteriovorax sp.]